MICDLLLGVVPWYFPTEFMGHVGQTSIHTYIEPRKCGFSDLVLLEVCPSEIHNLWGSKLLSFHSSLYHFYILQEMRFAFFFKIVLLKKTGMIKKNLRVQKNTSLLLHWDHWGLHTIASSFSGWDTPGGGGGAFQRPRSTWPTWRGGSTLQQPTPAW